MATVDKKFADRIIRNNGFYNEEDAADHKERPSPDNPRCIKLVEYDNAFGSKSYGAVFEGEMSDPMRYEKPTDFVKNPKVIWGYQP